MSGSPFERVVDAAVADRLADVALAAAKGAGARYVEVRVVGVQRESLSLNHGVLDAASDDRDLGLGVRALVDGWGYAATNLLDEGSVARCAQAAVAVAKAAAPPDGLRPEIPGAVTGTYATAVGRDPLGVAIDEKLAPFLLAHERMASVKSVKRTRAMWSARRIETLLAASNGTRVAQAVTLCGGGVTAIAERAGVVQTRTWPKGWEGNVLQGGFEILEGLDLPGHAARVAEEAAALTAADPIPAGDADIVLHPSQLSLQIHESIGHPTELDRALGQEISLAGASFLTPDQLDRLDLGAPIVNLTADATTPLGPGTFGWDDEGTPASRRPLVREGRFVDYLSGRDSAARVGRAAGGCMRAETWASLPIVRMVNVNLEPGAGSLDDLIGGMDAGYLLEQNKSWSIDDLRLNFQFSVEMAREIRGGRLTGRIFRDAVYQGVTPRFWQGCRAIAGPDAWEMWGWSYCGKGDPMQIMSVGHGCAPARFDHVTVRPS